MYIGFTQDRHKIDTRFLYGLFACIEEEYVNYGSGCSKELNLALIKLVVSVTRKRTCTTGKTTNDDDKRVARRIMSYV